MKIYSQEVQELIAEAKILAEKMRSEFTKEEIIEQFKEFLDMEDENDEIQHEIKMTDDKHYRDWYNKKKKDEEIDQFGIDED
jgi:hypothetical protein